MCGRFTLAVEAAELEAQFQGIQFPTQFAPRYNIAPSQPVLAIPNCREAIADFFIWGLVPSWAKDPSIGDRLINARGETLAEKPAFKGSYKYKRCLILADGFYEWKSAAGTKVKIPYYAQLQTRKPFGICGLWSEWRAPDGSEVRSCTIVTTTPNAVLAPIHNRMPVIIDARDRSAWLDPAPKLPEDLARLIRPYPAELMTAFPVSTLVNNPAADGPGCILPA